MSVSTAQTALVASARIHAVDATVTDRIVLSTADKFYNWLEAHRD